MGKCRKFTLPKGVTALEYSQTKSWYRSFGEGLVHGDRPSCPSRDPLKMMIELWKNRLARCFVLYTSSETKTKWWYLENPRDISRVWLWFMAKAARRLKVRAHPDYLAGSVNEATSPRDWFGYVRFTRSWWSLDLYKPFDVENRLKRISLMFVLLMSIQRYPPKKFADGRMLIWIEFDETVISSLQLLFPMTSLKFPPLI